MISKKIYITFIGVAIFLFIGMAGLSQKDNARMQESKAAESSSNAQEAVQQKVLSFNLEGMNERGKKSWEVNGEAAEVISATEVRLDNIVAKAYGDEAEATITAQKGVYDKTKNNVRLEQNVKATIVNKKGASGGGFFEAAGQIADAAEENKEGSKESSEGKKKETTITITCDGEVQFDYVHNLAYFDKNVWVTSSDGTINADKITVNLEPKTKKVYNIVAEGNVRIIQGENTTYSEKATYLDSEKKVVLTGKPKIVISQQESNNILGK